jgi:hypothetical protein
MANVEQNNAQRMYWEHNRKRILNDYDGGFAVIDWHQFKHYQTRQEVHRDFPVLAEEPIFGNRPLFIDISEEQWKEKPKHQS